MKEITILFQDCVLCGDKGKKKVLELNAKGYSFRKVSFVTKEGEELSNRAVFSYKIGSMPVYFYEDKAAATLAGLIEQIESAEQKTTEESEEQKTTEKPEKKSRKIKKTEELKDGTNSAD